MEKPKYSLHLFAGGGGGILADLLEGIQPVLAVEIEDFQRTILGLRFPELPLWDDVCTLREDNAECADAIADLKAHRDELVIAGGFPCQDISCAGKGAGLRGAKSGLWYEYSRIVREVRPRFVFVENSPFLICRGVESVLGEMAALGYWEDAINATVFGGRSGDAIEYLTPCENGFEGGANGMTPEERREEYPVRVTMKTRKRLQDEGDWPTPTVHGNGNREEYGGKSRDGLGTAVARAKSATGPTPVKSDTRLRGPNSHQQGLCDVVCRAESAPWPTPTCAGLDGGSNSRRAAKDRGRYIPNSAAISATGPTPTAHAAKPTTATETPRDALNYAVERGETKSKYYPTCGCTTMGGCSGSRHKLKELVEIGRLPPEDARAMAGGMKGAPNCGYLNPDWVEWLMNWPHGWTDPDADALIWLAPEDDPADLDPSADGYIPRITNVKTNRVKRIETLGNGQFPLTAAAAFIMGRAILDAALHIENQQEKN